MPNDLVPIDKIAKESGVASSALRYYERNGLISVGLKIGGRRHYPHSVIHRLSVIKVCQAVGFSLTEIAHMVNEDSGTRVAWRELARRRKQDIERQIKTLRSLADTLDSAMACQCDELAECPEMGPDGEIASRAATGRQLPIRRLSPRSDFELSNDADIAVN